MNVGDIGVTVYLSTGFNMSAFTSLQVSFLRPDNSLLSVTATLGTTTFTDPVSGITFTANQYAYYKTQLGDVIVNGNWLAKVIYTDAVQTLHSNYAPFVVGS